jgi:hypothetical protein
MIMMDTVKSATKEREKHNENQSRAHVNGRRRERT